MDISPSTSDTNDMSLKQKQQENQTGEQKELIDTSIQLRKNTNVARLKRLGRPISGGSSSSNDAEVKQCMKGRKPSKSLDENQERLAKALQKNIKSLVDTLPFKESEIPDSFVANGCLTEDECSTLRGIPERKDQIRKLVWLIKRRNYKIIETFLDIIKQHSPDVAENVWTDYRSSLSCQVSVKRTCELKKLKRDVDIKYVTDLLWSKNVISDVLFHDILQCERPAGDQDILWDQLLDVCKKNKKFDQLCSALSVNGFYTHIANRIKDHVDESAPTCVCKCQLIPVQSPTKQTVQHKTGDTSSSCSPRSSYNSQYSLFDISDTYVSGEDNEISQIGKPNSESGIEGGSLIDCKYTTESAEDGANSELEENNYVSMPETHNDTAYSQTWWQVVCPCFRRSMSSAFKHEYQNAEPITSIDNPAFTLEEENYVTPH